MIQNEEFLWVEKYRPKKIEDCVLPAEIKKIFQGYVDKGEVPNMILGGTPGTGKTTAARAMLEQMGIDYLFINASSDNGIGTIRNQIPLFASSVSLSGGRKIVLLDEADAMTTEAQKAFRALVEAYSKNCGFILTCNFKHTLIEPLHSRLVSVDFRFTKKEVAELQIAFFKRACWILKAENIEFDKAIVAQIIQRHSPDWRRILGELQHLSTNGKIDASVVRAAHETSIEGLVEVLKKKDYEGVRKWTTDNADNDNAQLYRKLFDAAKEYLQPQSIPALVLIISRYQAQEPFVADHQINALGMLVECMMDLEFK